MVRLNPPGFQRLEQAAALEVQVGGSESNTAAALSCLGRRAAWWSRLPDNPLGRRIESEVRARGVDTSGVIWDDGRAGVYFLEFGASPRPHEITYDRADSAASRISAEDVDIELLKSARHLHLTGITPALSESCSDAVLAAAEAAKLNSLTVSFDVNFRRKLWSAESARRTLEMIFPFVDLLITGAADSAEVFQIDGTTVEIASEIRQRYGVPAVIVTAGVDGAAAASESGIYSAPAISANEVDRVGAGDAFDAGAIDGFLDGDLERGIRLGCAMAALKRTIPGDMLTATRDEIERVISSGSTAIRR